MATSAQAGPPSTALALCAMTVGLGDGGAAVELVLRKLKSDRCSLTGNRDVGITHQQATALASNGGALLQSVTLAHRHQTGCASRHCLPAWATPAQIYVGTGTTSSGGLALCSSTGTTSTGHRAGSIYILVNSGVGGLVADRALLFWQTQTRTPPVAGSQSPRAAAHGTVAPMLLVTALAAGAEAATWLLNAGTSPAATLAAYASALASSSGGRAGSIISLSAPATAAVAARSSSPLALPPPPTRACVHVVQASASGLQRSLLLNSITRAPGRQRYRGAQLGHCKLWAQWLPPIGSGTLLRHQWCHVHRHRQGPASGLAQGMYVTTGSGDSGIGGALVLSRGARLHDQHLRAGGRIYTSNPDTAHAPPAAPWSIRPPIPASLVSAACLFSKHRRMPGWWSHLHGHWHR
jgi:hypothetical protein